MEFKQILSFFFNLGFQRHKGNQAHSPYSIPFIFSQEAKQYAGRAAASDFPRQARHFQDQPQNNHGSGHPV